MGKRQHQKDKMYLTCTEWSTIYGGRRANSEQANQAAKQFRRLPFDHCSISLQPFEHPYCTPDGIIYDLANIIPFIKKYGKDPVSGLKCDSKSLIKLNFFKNSEGAYHCPVLYKPFTENSHIVAIKTTGNVFSYEAIEQLNLKPKHFKDLLTDEPFSKKDMIELLDPNNLDKYNVAQFYHVKHQLKWNEEEEEEKSKDPNRNLRNINHETKATLHELGVSQAKEAQEKMKRDEEEEKKAGSSGLKEARKLDKFNAAHYSTGVVSVGTTSTIMDPTLKLEAAILDDDTVRYSRVKKKGYVKLETNFGALNFELYCDHVTKTCDNFIRLCNQGYYDSTKFHRLIKNFMVQGGDPTGTGKGGDSAFGGTFEDEFKPFLSHEGRGMLSMANSGPDTNKSQFFITFRSCKHLNKKHTIFGKLVGGKETLDKIESVKTDDKDKPLEDIMILKTIVFVDPFKEIDDQIEKEREKLEKSNSVALKFENLKKVENLKPLRKGIGAFIDLKAIGSNDNNTSGDAASSDIDRQPTAKKKKMTSSSFGNFSNW